MSTRSRSVLFTLFALEVAACARDHTGHDSDPSPVAAQPERGSDDATDLPSSEDDEGPGAQEPASESDTSPASEPDAASAASPSATSDVREVSGPDAGSRSDFDLRTTPLLDPAVPGISPRLPRLPTPGFDDGPCARAVRPEPATCSWMIPNEIGRHVAPNTARVTYQSGSVTIVLAYDPTCAEPNAWHYVDAHRADQVQLCDATCTELHALGDPPMQVEYPCAYPIAI